MTSVLLSVLLLLLGVLTNTTFASSPGDPPQNITGGFWWEMSTYNGWDMPFAKRCEITGSDNKSSAFPTNEYKLMVDPSAYFSVVVIPTKFPNANKSGLIRTSINYTAFGCEENQKILEGYWMNLTMTVYDTRYYLEGTTVEFVANLTMFVVDESSTIQGTSGTIALARTPFDLEDYSFIYKWDHEVAATLDYLQFVVNQTDQFALKNGWTFFGYSKTFIQTMTGMTDEERLSFNTMGVMELTSQYPSKDTIQNNYTNPYLLLKLNFLEFSNFNIEFNNLLGVHFSETVYMASSKTGNVLPSEIFEYMQDIFFDQLCTPNQAGYSGRGYQGCMCDGLSYQGMPILSYSILQNGYDIAYNFVFEPSDYLQYPKVDPQFSTTFCELSLQSLWEYGTEASELPQAQVFTLGRIFIAKYGLIVRQILDETGGVIMELYSQPGESEPVFWGDIIAFLFFVILQIVFMGVMTTKKFVRLQKSAEVFKTIQKMNMETNVGVSTDFQKNMSASKQNIRDLQDGANRRENEAKENINEKKAAPMIELVPKKQ